MAVTAAAHLDAHPNDALRLLRYDEKPYWDIERARIGTSREVPVELIVNGHSVEKRELEADGKVSHMKFSYKPKQSSWVAVRIFPSSHTNPIFVEVDGKPIRASKKSAQWCLDAVEVCWNSKLNNTRPHERAAARAGYDVAKEAYAKVLKEAGDD